MDELTGLSTIHPKSNFFEQAKNKSENFGMILLDIDGFNYCTYHYGYQESDNQLKQIASIIQKIVPKGADIFRSDGDEFTVFLHETDMATVVSIAMQLKDSINQNFSLLEPIQKSWFFPDKSTLSWQSHLSISCGIVFYPQHGKNFADLRQTAFKAMYKGGKGLNRDGVLAIRELTK